MAVSSAIIDLTGDNDDNMMHVDGEQVTEETVTSSSWTSVVSNSNEHDNEQAAPDEASHEDHEAIKETAIQKQHNTSKYPAICDKPNQPRHFNFPKRRFEASKIVSRSFQCQWFNKWKWIHYDEAEDLAFCHVCVTAMKTGKMQNHGNVDVAFIERRFCNWKDASGDKGAFSSHERSSCHKKAVDVVVTLPKTTKDVGEMLSSTHQKEKNANRQYLLKVMQNIRFLARQGIPLRGDGDEHDSNFIQLLYL